jgi:hypothetical protein
MAEIDVARYHAYTKEMLAFDALGDEVAADKIRDILDVIWYSLSDEEVRSLHVS